MRTARNPAEVECAVDALRREKFARSTVGPKESRCRLFFAIARRACGVPVYPLTSETLETVAGVLKHADYRSAHMYLNEAKLKHIEDGFEWTLQLERQRKLCETSCLRGLGPPKKAGEIRLREIANLPEQEASLAGSGPMFTKRTWLIASFWMLREIELAGLRVHESHIAVGEDWAELCLPMSKTDTGGLGKRRVLKCLCSIKDMADGHAAGSTICPVCALKRQLTFACGRAGVSRNEDRALEIPLFPTATGETASKEATIQAWKAMVSKRPEGEEIGGHSARRSGAKTMSRCGWELWKTQFHGRWGSDAVKGYTEEVFAEVARNWHLEDNLQEQASRRASRPVLDEELARAVKEITERARVKPIVKAFDKAAFATEIMEKVRSELDTRPKFVRSTAADVWHTVASCNYDTPTRAWQTRCGWRFATRHQFELRRTIPSQGETLCTKCSAFSKEA
jgi:hypothetical protein